MLVLVVLEGLTILRNEFVLRILDKEIPVVRVGFRKFFCRDYTPVSSLSDPVSKKEGKHVESIQ